MNVDDVFLHVFIYVTLARFFFFLLSFFNFFFVYYPQYLYFSFALFPLFEKFGHTPVYKKGGC